MSGCGVSGIRPIFQSDPGITSTHDDKVGVPRELRPESRKESGTGRCTAMPGVLGDRVEAELRTAPAEGT